MKVRNEQKSYFFISYGERIMKSYGTMEGVYINGAPQGITFHETDNFTLYPASILTVNKNRFTKHYFIGSQRIASRIGTGTFNNVYGTNGSYVTAGQQDYAERMNQIEAQKETYYKELGIAPGVPTEKGAYGDPENTGVGYNTIIMSLGDHSVPEGWVQTPKHNDTPNTEPGAPISWNDPTSPDDPQAGYGYIPNDTTREETFFFHSDHLGSTSYITNDKGNITQYDAYLPYGELLVDEHSSSEDLPYKFNGKELDAETGLYYYGARYMNPVTSLWYGVDLLAEKYTNISAYVYCHTNPIRLIDPTGMADKDRQKKALERIQEFENNSNLSVFPNIPKNQYARDLRLKVSKPWLIDQGQSGTCGAAVISRYLAEEMPDLYVEAAINLYETGVFTHGEMTLKKTDKMRHGTLSDLASKKVRMTPVDAVMLGAITNVNNKISTMNTFSGDSGANTFMYPSFIKRFMEGFAGVNVKTISGFPTQSALRGIDYAHSFVIGLVRINSDGYIVDGMYPNHYVEIRGFTNDNKAKYWEWGESNWRYTHINGLVHGIFNVYIMNRQ